MTVHGAASIDTALQARRIVVVGADTDLATVLTKLLRADRLAVEVAFVPRWRTAGTRAYGLPSG
ncbi:MAG: peptidase M50, partial [Mycobacterium sp.]